MTEETDAPQGGTEGEAIVAPPQVETPAAAETSEDTAEQQTGAETPGQADETGDQPKRKPWWEKRFDELTAKRYDAEREAAYWRGLAEAGRQPAPSQPEPAGPPTLEQCGWDDSEFQRQTADYFRKEAERAAERVIESRTAKDREQAQIQTATAKLQEGAAKHADFMDAVHDIPITPAVTELLATDPNAAEVLYAVGKDSSEARRIFSLSSHLQAVELGKIAARLESPKAPSPKPIPPAPPQTVSGLSAGLNKTPEDMSMAEFIVWREGQEKTKT